MKATLAFAALALSITAAVSAQAQQPAPAPADFASHKTAILAHLDERMAAMTTMRGCVANAATKADLKTCRQQSHGAMHTKRAPA